MEYDNIDSKERLTGRAWFLATGDNGSIDLGNVQLINLNYGIKRKEHYKARRGSLIMDRYDAYAAMPQWEITGDEFVSANLALIFLGTDVADYTQSVVSATPITFVGHIGKWVDIISAGQTPHMGMTAGSSLTTPSSKTEGFGADYVIDRAVGKFYLPKNSTIADGTSCTVNVTTPNPGPTFDKILPPFSNLNRTGTMRLIEEDDDVNNVPKTVHDFPVSLSTDNSGQTKVDDYKAFKMIATITDPTSWTILKRSA